MSDKKQIAEALRLAATYLGSGMHDNAVESLQRQANALDLPHKVDRSLRGWVLVEEPISQSIYWACRKGLQQWILHEDEPDYTWATVEDLGWRVTKIRTLQPGEVVAKIPPMSEWPEESKWITLGYVFENRGMYITPTNKITREQAERMEEEK